MIIVHIATCNGALRSFHASGHAGAGSAGADVVCAAFTGLVRTFWRYMASCQALASTDREKSGFLNFTLVDKVDALVPLSQMFILGLMDLSYEYPQHIKIDRKEEVSDGN